ncbi:ferrous iron transport protein B [Spirochaetia bacterium]|nr:ferrous iron transport protein B [Spirochaetia bacterium]GHT49675.1 ferrous iron transport protein B [Spirochaetia bacterium]
MEKTISRTLASGDPMPRKKMSKSIRIALTGNQNSGKTTLFNALTGSNQFVGNWPGVTVEKKEGYLRTNHYHHGHHHNHHNHHIGHHGEFEIKIMDLPGIYSISPYSLEEVISRDYILDDKPDVIVNVIDGSNLERNLFLTSQLLEIGIPVVAAINMIDIVEKNGDLLDMSLLEKQLGCSVVGISALKQTGLDVLIKKCINVAGEEKEQKPLVVFSKELENAIKKLSETLSSQRTKIESESLKRFYSLRIIEHDDKFIQKYKVEYDNYILEACNDKFTAVYDDDIESIITEERYNFISKIRQVCLKKKNKTNIMVSDKIDGIVTNRILALPIFAVFIFLIYFISVTTVGAWVTDWMNDGVFGDGFNIGENIFVPGIPVAVSSLLEAAGTAMWLNSLILDGIIAGVGAVLGFVPQLFVLFFFLAFLEACGYMSRVAFILDRLFRHFGLSGKSFIPMLIGTGCGVPGIMSSRTIENIADRRMTIMTTTFMPCSAKLPIIALISGAVLGGKWWIAPSAYLMGIVCVIVSGLILKKTKMFAGDISPFVMELPAYHLPTAKSIWLSMWERGSSFIQRAGSVILLSAVVIWFLSNFGFVDGKFTMVEDLNEGILAYIGTIIAVIFKPLGFGTWDATVATITGLIAKENVVGTMGVLYGFSEVAEDGMEMWSTFASHFTSLSGFAFLAFNLYCPPCFAAIGAISREMNNGRWTAFAVGYQLTVGYVLALLIYQFGTFFAGGPFGAGTFAAFVFAALILFAIFRRPKWQQL